MTAGDLYPLLEYSITQVSSNGQIHSYFTTREALIEPYLKNLKQRSSWEVLQMKQSFIRFLASQEPCCVWEEENESVYICSAGYKAIILSDKMLLIDSPRPVNRILLEEEVQRCPWFQTSSWLGTIGFYILFLMICLPEYRRQISSCAHIVDAMHSPCKSVYVKAVNHCPLLKLVQKELDMHCIQLSLQTKHNNTSWQIIMDGKQQHCSLFKQLDELRKRVRCYQNGLESQNLVHHHRILCEKTKLIVFSFFFNILLCAILIGSTSANSFGTNLNIPLYRDSASGMKACLWYIVSFSSIILASCGIFWFLRLNNMVTKYIIATRNNYQWEEKVQGRKEPCAST